MACYEQVYDCVPLRVYPLPILRGRRGNVRARIEDLVVGLLKNRVLPNSEHCDEGIVWICYGLGLGLQLESGL